MPQKERKLRILFLCTGNTCRSQMAEGWARAIHRDRIDPWSAGIAPGALDERAVRVMAEAGADISGQRSKGIDALPDLYFDLAVTVCDRARESCPVYPRASRTMHASFPDPPELARDAKSEEEALVHYRRVRDEIREFVEGLPKMLQKVNDSP